jgi:hypothetical protein
MFEKVSLRKKLKYKAVVVPEQEVLMQPDDVVLISGVVLHEVPQQLSLSLGELMVELCVSGDLNGHLPFNHPMVVLTHDDLSETALAQDLKDLIAVEQVVAHSDSVVAIIVVEVGLGCFTLLTFLQVLALNPLGLEG